MGDGRLPASTGSRGRDSRPGSATAAEAKGMDANELRLAIMDAAEGSKRREILVAELQRKNDAANVGNPERAADLAARRLAQSAARQQQRGRDVSDFADKQADKNGWKRGTKAAYGPYQDVIYAKGDYIIMTRVKGSRLGKRRVVDITVREKRGGSAPVVDSAWPREDKRKQLRKFFKKYGG